MATKMCFVFDKENVYEEKTISFTYIKGMAFSQKQKNVLSFHSAIKIQYPDMKILEISTKSDNPLGSYLSAFNLKLGGCPIESIYQSSKVFDDDVQYEFLKEYNPREAKQYISNANKANLKCFRFNGVEFALEPKHMFYDYIYINALMQIPEISQELREYDIFTDIEFNEKKQVNTQARSCAIYSYMLRSNTVGFYLSSLENFKQIYKSYNHKEEQQLSFF